MNPLICCACVHTASALPTELSLFQSMNSHFYVLDSLPQPPGESEQASVWYRTQLPAGAKPQLWIVLACSELCEHSHPGDQKRLKR